jgi:hypothetical protein
MAEVQGAVVANPGRQFVSIGNQVRMEQTRMRGKGKDEYKGKENERQTDANPLNRFERGRSGADFCGHGDLLGWLNA